MSLLSNKLESILFVSGKEVEESFIKEKLEVFMILKLDLIMIL